MLKRLMILSFLSLTVASPLAAQVQTDTTYLFRFVPGRDMFYVPYSGNDKELTRLEECIRQYREDILAGEMPLNVDGYCNSAPTENENLATAKIRSNRVKSELIIRSGLTESCFVTRNHASGGDYVTVRLVVPATDNKREAEAAERMANEQKDAQARLEAERAAAEQVERERQAAEKETPTQQAAPAAPNPSTNWYAGIQGGIPFGVSALSSFGADKTRAGWSAGIYGGYRFNPVLSLEAQAAWGQLSLSARSCCPGYWLGSDGNLYEGAVAGMTGRDWHDLKSRVFIQRYGIQLNVNLLGFFAATRRSRWTLELAPHLHAVGTKADFRTLGGNATAMKGTAHWHLGAGGNLQAGYGLTEHLRISIYSGITYLTGKPLDGTPSHRHKANYIWESGLRLGWSFGNTHKGKEAAK